MTQPIKYLPPAYSMPTVRKHAAPITALTGITLENLTTHGKQPATVSARQELWAMLFLLEGWSSWVIRARFQVCHTTFLYHIRKWATANLGTPPKASLADIRTAYYAQTMGQAA